MKWDTRCSTTLQQLLTHKDFIMCRAVGGASLERFNADDQGIKDELLKVEENNYSPDCLGQDQIDVLNPELLQKSGLRRMDPGDLRLPDPTIPLETKTPSERPNTYSRVCSHDSACRLEHAQALPTP
jgi:hypothetical protein